MIKFSEKSVFLCCGPTDMRKSINGLTILVKEVFSLDPFMAAMFVFCNRNRDRIKILEWDGDGFWLYFKRLERGRFRWPAACEESVMNLDVKELLYLIEGAKLEKKLKREEILERKIS